VKCTAVKRSRASPVEKASQAVGLPALADRAGGDPLNEMSATSQEMAPAAAANRRFTSCRAGSIAETLEWAAKLRSKAAVEGISQAAGEIENSVKCDQQGWRRQAPLSSGVAGRIKGVARAGPISWALERGHRKSGAGRGSRRGFAVVADGSAHAGRAVRTVYRGNFEQMIRALGRKAVGERSRPLVASHGHDRPPR